MATRLLIIHQQLIFAVTIKQALEQTGLFDVHPFTTPDAAFDYLRDHPQDAALVDFTLPNVPGTKVVEALRDVQPDIAVIVTPDHPTAGTLDIQGVIDTPFTARDLIPVIQQAIEASGEPSSAPPQAHPAPEQRTTKPLNNDLPRPSTSSVTEKAGQTRNFNDEPESVPPVGKTRSLDHEPSVPPPAPIKTGALRERPESEPPTELPEFSTLDSVLKSFDFDPLTEQEENTPSVPEHASDVARPENVPEAETHTFDEILGTIETDQPLEKPKPRTGFDELVDSMRGKELHKPLPERQKSSLDFTLKSGMDEVLKEIEQAKDRPKKEHKPQTKQSSQESGDTFQKLAQEEPPLPSLEENGTVSDLMTGIGDTGFRNVLAILRGEEIEEQAGPEQPRRRGPTKDDIAFEGREKPAQTTEGATQPPQASEPQEAASSWSYDDSDNEDESVAHVVLQTTLDSNLPDSLPLADVMNEIESRLAAHKLSIRPLPSWDIDTGAFRSLSDTGVMEPDFLPEELPPGEMIQPPAEVPELPPSDASSRTTQPSPALQQSLELPSQETDTAVDSSYLEETTRSKPVQIEAETPTQPDIAAELEWPEAELEDWPAVEEAPQEPASAAIEYEWLPDVEPQTDTAPVPAETETPSSIIASMDTDFDTVWPVEEKTSEAQEIPLETDHEPAAEATEVEPHDPYIAQLALNLTHASLELTAEGTLLSRGGEVVAAAGHLAPEDTAELLQTISSDPETGEGARFRFVSLPSSGKDYMLYSIQTTGGLVLSMVFTGATPLRVIRKQAQRLVEALESVPEVPVEAAPPEAIVETPSEQAVATESPIVPVVMNAYSCVWLLQDPNEHLNDAVAQAIIAGLSIQLQEQGWQIHTLQVHEDFVYVLADVPGERPPNEIIRELKQRSADIAHAQNPDLVPQHLWADSYLVLTPGRELQTEEILEFINFQRML